MGLVVSAHASRAFVGLFAGLPTQCFLGLSSSRLHLRGFISPASSTRLVSGSLPWYFSQALFSLVSSLNLCDRSRLRGCSISLCSGASTAPTLVGGHQVGSCVQFACPWLRLQALSLFVYGGASDYQQAAPAAVWHLAGRLFVQAPPMLSGWAGPPVWLPSSAEGGVHWVVPVPATFAEVAGMKRMAR